MKVSTSPVSSEKKHPEDVSYGRNSACTPRAVSMLRSVIAAIAITITVPNIGHAQSSSSVGQKAILVTGASTGIGRKLTEQLAADGYFIYATARKDADLQALATIKNVQGVRLDVTHPDDIAAAVETVTKGGRGLYALVNNAGIGSASPLMETPPEEFASMMAVNVTGPYLMTKAFAPLIVAAKGRIINIGSISGLLSSANLGPYQMSKAAVETFTDVLARELASSGVHVSIVEPGSYNSDILKNAVRRAGMNADVADRSKLKEPDEVVAATKAALFEPRPKRRYMVVPDGESAEITIRAQLEKLVQVNEGQPYTYNRTALIKMLDEALAGARPMQPPTEGRVPPTRH
jgi:NAD(P)-dependent dehydrogenase (short-subunit alcohol dehydrogenase family)